MSATLAADVLAEVNARTGAELVLLGPAEHGLLGGAVFVSWPDGREGVLTCPVATVDEVRTTAGVLPLARSRGLPVPRYDHIVELDDGGVATLQERLPGAPARRFDASMVDAVVELWGGFAGLLAGRPDVLTPPLHLGESGPVYPRHETLEGHGPRSRRLLRRIREIGAGDPHEMTGDDLLHTDCSLGNILFAGDRPVGLVDWIAARGDRWFALVQLRFELSRATVGQGGVDVDPRAPERLDEILRDRVDPAVLRMYWAHWTLQKLHWTIPSSPDEVVDLYLRLGESGLF